MATAQTSPPVPTGSPVAQVPGAFAIFSSTESPRTLKQEILTALFWMFVGLAALHLAYMWNPARPLIAVYLLALVQLARQQRWRLAFYPGLLIGYGAGILHLGFFYTLFSFGAFGLWLVFAFWIGLFVALARLALRRFGRYRGLAALPFLWTGLEYFRSELYPLRFSWVTPGFAFAEPPWLPVLPMLGVFGVGFLITSLVCGSLGFSRLRWQAVALSISLLILALAPLQDSGRVVDPAKNRVKVAGVQMEFPAENEVMVRLHELLKAHPDAELIVLSEYTFEGPVPEKVRNWCAANERYLIAGGKEPTGDGKFYNTAYVIGPDGDTVFTQAKAVPIQFMKDGLAAERQRLWESPWGRIGICVCYDLSYTRVTDRLVRLGAEALIVPTMDVIDWGKAQHELHARVAPVRAAEYKLPIFRLASSGISQHADALGRTVASAPCGGDGAFIATDLEFRGSGGLPADRWLGPACVGVTATLMLWFLVQWGFGLRPPGP